MIPDYPNPLYNSEAPIKTGFNAKGYEAFMADNFSIVNKDKLEVPFIANPAQRSMNYWMQDYYDLLILKARKMGFSSDALGIGATKFLTGRNEKCVSMSFDQEASDKQLIRAKHFIKSYELKNNLKVPLKYNSKSEMVWEDIDENGRPFVNTLRVGTARNTSFGRGDDITFLHLTEVSLSDVPMLLAGVGEACIKGAHKILETTANGFNSYKQFWDRTVLNQTGFAALFYSPLWEYNEMYLEAKRKALGKLFDQEYPMTPQLAFLTSGDPYFDSEAMRWYLDQIEKERVYA
jgi:hypothetical protein